MRFLLDELPFFLELLVSGLLIGMMYALVALGFVLIYKASQAINFAQGEFVMFGGFVVAASMRYHGLSLVLSLALGFGAMVVIGLLMERLVLRPLTGRGVIAIIMATIGLASILKGLLLLIWGPLSVNIPLPIREEPVEIFTLLVKLVAVVGAIISLVFLAGFSFLFLRSRLGIALRAVADNQTVAQLMGIDVRHYFALTWVTAGVVATIGGVMWGNMIGADVHTALIGLKVFPVVILGGLTSVPGAVLGGLIVGAVENLAAGYIDPFVGGGTKDFVPYILMILALMVRPYGFFGEQVIERV
ncbi:MAG: branched-chain amino acid ABC transporter permease [Candidatus Rokubacteria bacterium]|nr:branched-chain amino acid ABC transporter permease [Candidatus Rokubacteria bacterium]